MSEEPENRSGGGVESQPATVKTELGLEVPMVSVPGRRRTNEDWQRVDPDTYEEVLEAILGLELNVSKLAEDFAPLRKNADGTVGLTAKSMRRLIGVMIQNDPRLGITKFRELKKLKLELVEAEMIDKVSELGDKATKADLLGAAAMAMKLSRDTLNAQGGAAVVIVKHEHSITVDTETQRRREEMGRRLAAKRENAIDVPVEVMGAEDLETVRLGVEEKIQTTNS